jgi:hypothetical protein
MTVETDKKVDENKPTVEDAGSDSDDSDDVPDLEVDQTNAVNANGDIDRSAFNAASAADASKQSRSEKKARKAMLKLGLKLVPNVNRVTMKKAKQVGVGSRGTRTVSTHRRQCVSQEAWTGDPPCISMHVASTVFKSVQSFRNRLDEIMEN